MGKVMPGMQSPGAENHPYDGQPPESEGGREGIFDRDRFLLKQKVLTINQKYHVSDEEGNQLLFVQRPSYVFRNMLAMVAAIASFFVVMALLFVVDAAFNSGPRGAGPRGQTANALFAVSLLITFALAVGAAMFVGIGLSPKRHVTFFRDDSKTDAQLYVLQDKKFAITNFTYSVMDSEGNLIATLRKNYLHDILRKKWECLNANGQVLCVIREDSAIKAFFRRFLGGIIAALLKTDFIITDPTGAPLGKFMRKYTLMDRYVLDMTPDAARLIDRRVAVAIGVMLDTGEKR